MSHDADVTSQYTSFEYDDAGNITETKLVTDTSTVVETRTYNDVNEITANSVDDGISVVNWTYGHDANGNLTSRSDGTDTWTYTWDDENRLIEVEKNSTTQATYQYDSNSRLIQRVAGGTTTNYTWDGWDLVKEEKTGTITETTRYAVPQGMITSFDRNGSRYYLHGDGLSSSQLVTNSSGNQAARIIYGAWGNELYASDSVPNGLDARFVGGLGVRNDATTGLIYMRHRWYDPETQRFISRDPIGLNGDSNAYRYGAGSPTVFVDPGGLDYSYDPKMSPCDRSAITRALGNINSVPLGRDLTHGLSINGIDVIFVVANNKDVVKHYIEMDWVSPDTKASVGLTDTFSIPNTAVVYLDLRWAERDNLDLSAVVGHELAHAFQDFNANPNSRDGLYENIKSPGKEDYARFVEAKLRRLLGLPKRSWSKCEH